VGHVVVRRRDGAGVGTLSDVERRSQLRARGDVRIVIIVKGHIVMIKRESQRHAFCGLESGGQGGSAGWGGTS
jgi:hypothetical protein